MRFVLEPTIVMQIIGDEKFYKACPSYFFMKENGLATHAKWQSAVVERRPDCDDCNDKGIYKPVVKTFVDHTVRMFKEDPQLLKPLTQYLSLIHI